MLNKAILVGRLVADPELRTTPNGISVATFRIACDRPYVSKGAERQADFINIVAWRERAEFVTRFFKKGNAIGVDGSIQTREYDDKEGKRRYVVEVLADRLFFVESKSAASQSASGGGYSAPAPGISQRSAPASDGVAFSSGSPSDFEPIDSEEDLPF